MQTLNDVHSQLNPTLLAKVERPATKEALQTIYLSAIKQGSKISVAGGRHAMGGQQFAEGSLHIDTSELSKVISVDEERGLLHIEAGAHWPTIIKASHAMKTMQGVSWGIRQKQTGVDAVSLGGSISANAHGRGLLLRPLVDDIDDLTILDACGHFRFCNRNENAELFSLVIGGYGLFGIIYSATLRLSPRQRLERVVDVIDLDDAMNAVMRRVEEGCLYGDFQFAIDTEDPRFLRRGVFACYRPVANVVCDSETSADIPKEKWLQLLRLAHEDKRAAFRLYAQHYLLTDSQQYWSDTMQLSTYIPSYVEYLESARNHELGSSAKESLVIGEHYISREHLLHFMNHAKQIFVHLKSEVIYGTIRAIRKDDLSFLPWAKGDFVCVIFNIRTPHTVEGRARTEATFRQLIDASNALGGCFYLTYHRYASVTQVETAYPEFRAWLKMKLHYDPDERFSSDWYVHYRDAFRAFDSTRPSA